MTDTFTAGYAFVKPDFNFVPWHDKLNGNWDKVDALLNTYIGAFGAAGIWAISTMYTKGDRVYDPDWLGIWLCEVTHTSSASLSFEDDRAAHPTYWSFIDQGLGLRGAWAPATVYAPGDLVYDTTEVVLAVANTSHISTSGIRVDAANWTFVADFKAAVVTAAALAAATGAAAAAASAASAATSASVSTVNRTLQVSITGNGVITPGVVPGADVEVPYNCQIVGVRLLSTISGSIVIDVWKDSYANFPPTIADKITASAPPTLSAAAKSQDLTLTGWSKNLAEGDILRFNVNSVSTVQAVTLVLDLVKI